LAGLLGDSDPDVRILVSDLARGLPSPQATLLLCARLETESDINVCAAIVEVLAEVGGPEAVPTLRRCAARFAGVPFLTYSINVTVDRIGAGEP
jgi:HEAT repeat protein